MGFTSTHVMKFREWLTQHSLSAAWAAKQLGASQGAVSLWLNGKRTPTVTYINKIHLLTDGAVTSFDWEPEDDEDKD